MCKYEGICLALWIGGLCTDNSLGKDDVYVFDDAQSINEMSQNILLLKI